MSGLLKLLEETNNNQAPEGLLRTIQPAVPVIQQMKELEARIAKLSESLRSRAMKAQGSLWGKAAGVAGEMYPFRVGKDSFDKQLSAGDAAYDQLANMEESMLQDAVQQYNLLRQSLGGGQMMFESRPHRYPVAGGKYK